MLSDCEFEVIHTPGHCPGSISLYCEDQGVAFVGDLIFKDGAVGRTDLPRASADQLLISIHKLFDRLDTETIIYPGHGPPAVAGQERVMFA